WGGVVRGAFGLAETLRPGAAEVLAKMRAQGLQVEVLTGDGERAGAALARRLGVPVRSGLLPHQKMEAVAAAESGGPVAMAGDGLNDAPALARAGVGFALGCGADITRQTADVSLLGDDLSQIGWTLGLARRTYRTIGWNLAWAFVYNVAGIALAMGGRLHPVLAAGAMVLSSALVVGNSLRLTSYD
ncbi:MAG: cation-translocating P-type ATPase, partial [Caldilineae bacterium]